MARYHPDKVQHLGKEFQAMAAERAAELTEAYRILSDDTRRAEYDRVRSTSSAAMPAAPSPPREGAAAERPASPSEPPHAGAEPKPGRAFTDEGGGRAGAGK